MKVKIHHEGNNIIVVLLLILMMVNATAYVIMPYKIISYIFLAISAVLFLCVVNFFRSPRRRFRGDTSDAVVSSVDGRVVALEETYEDEYLHANVIQLSVFMNVFNVHANWVPVQGEVKYVKHHSGRFMSAWLPKASTENERSTVVISTPTGHDILVRQIAGAVARRIVTYLEPDETVGVDQHLGFIKFGSRVDIYLPLDTEIFVKIGDRTTGGVTLIARLKQR